MLTVAAPTYHSPARPTDAATDPRTRNIAVAMQRVFIEERKQIIEAPFNDRV
jgi:hypothetical protein